MYDINNDSECQILADEKDIELWSISSIFNTVRTPEDVYLSLAFKRGSIFKNDYQDAVPGINQRQLFTVPTEELVLPEKMNAFSVRGEDQGINFLQWDVLSDIVLNDYIIPWSNYPGMKPRKFYSDYWDKVNLIRLRDYVPETGGVTLSCPLGSGSG